MPAERLFHLWEISSLMPCLRHVSPTFPPTSTSFRIATIWLSVNLDFFL